MYKDDKTAIEAFGKKYLQLKSEIAKVIIGQEKVVEDVLTTIFSQGHALLIGVPGLAKTLLINTISQTLDLSYNRIQFTPDLMPSDILGTEILNKEKRFEFIQGPVFANIILADEINRTPPKTQAALLEAMQEKAVTIGGKNYRLDQPFFVLATQNPIEQEGTYPLPEAQLDRFMFNIKVAYPDLSEEISIVKNTTTGKTEQLNTILQKEELLYFQQLLMRIPVPDNVYEYAVRLARKTRPNDNKTEAIAKKYISWGAGPRASQYLIIGAKTHAALKGKFSPDMEDVNAVALNVLRHRIVINYKAEAEGWTKDKIIKDILE
jgi:MoxR-like ATPase